MERLKVGLIGTGGIGRHLAKSLEPVEEIELVGVADVDVASAERAAQEFGTKVYASWQGMLADPNVGAVILATPPFAHLEQVLAAAGAGKHIFCEKPMAVEVAPCDQMIEAAEKAGVVLIVGHVLRLFPLFWKSKEILDTGVLGGVRSISIRRLGNGISLFGQGWRTKRMEGGGLILETNVHEIDYARFIGGEPKQVCATGGRVIGFGDYEEYWQGLFWFEQGATGAVESSLIDTLGKYEVMIQCEKGTMYHGGFGGELRYRTFGGEERIIPREEINTPDPYTWELRAFARNVLHGEPMPFTVWDGRQAVAVGCACIRSMESGQIEKV